MQTPKIYHLLSTFIFLYHPFLSVSCSILFLIVHSTPSSLLSSLSFSFPFASPTFLIFQFFNSTFPFIPSFFSFYIPLSLNEKTLRNLCARICYVKIGGNVAESNCGKFFVCVPIKTLQQIEETISWFVQSVIFCCILSSHIFTFNLHPQ